MRKKSFWLAVLVLAVLTFGSYFFFCSGFFQVKEVQVSGADAFAKEIKGFVPLSKNILLLDVSKIKENILSVFPQIAEADIGRVLPGLVVVQVKERQAALLWCEPEQCYLADKEGVLFQASDGGEELLKVSGQKEYFDKSVIDSILLIRDSLPVDVKTNEIIIEPERLVLNTEEGWEAYYDYQSDVRWQTAKLAAVLKEKIPPGQRHNLEYVELRFGNLASYKYR